MTVAELRKWAEEKSKQTDDPVLHRPSTEKRVALAIITVFAMLYDPDNSAWKEPHSRVPDDQL